MQQLEPIPSPQQAALTILSTSVILKEQDQKEATKHIAKLLQRLSKLYQINNWTEENAVFLAEWIIDNYKYEELSMIENVLRNPPKIKNHHGDIESNWRLTPDTIAKWMSIALENAATERERSQEAFKLAEKNVQPLSIVDYDAFRKRLAEGTALKDPAPEHWSKEEAYLKFKAERAQKLILENPPKENEKE
jgi:hypothetical protein